MKLLIRDRWLMAVDKPAGLLSQPGLGPEQSDSVITRLQQQDQSLRLVHRLDRDTSGVLLLACLLYTSPSPRDAHESRMPSSA